MAPRRKSNKGLVIQLVNPVATALEQAREEVKRGVHQPTIYERVREENAMRKKMERKIKAKGKTKTVSTPRIEFITPWARALEQAKNDLKRGSYQMDIYDRALEQDAIRKKLHKDRQARRAKPWGTRRNILPEIKREKYRSPQRKMFHRLIEIV